MATTFPHSPDRGSSLAANLLLESITDLLRLAVSMSHARFAVARIGQQPPIVTDATAALEEEEEVAARTLLATGPALAFGSYACVKLVDARCRVWGTMTVAGIPFKGPRDQLNDRLIAIRRQIVRCLELDEREAFLRAVMENIADVLAIVNAEGLVTYVSEQQTMVPEDRATFDALLKAFAQSDRIDRTEVRFERKDGSSRVLELHGTNLLDDPQIRGWLITASEVAGRELIRSGAASSSSAGSRLTGEILRFVRPDDETRTALPPDIDLELHEFEVAGEAGGETMVPSRPRVLIVEDEVAITAGLRWVLETEGMKVHAVRLAAEVLPAIKAFKPDVVLLDLTLPDGDGRAVREQLPRRLPVIFSSGRLGVDDVAKNGPAVLIKPYTMAELLSAIDKALLPGNHLN